MIKTTATLDLVERMITAIGDDPTRPGLKKTPARVVRSWEHLFGGYQLTPASVLKTEFQQEDHRYQDMVVLGDIEFYSTCEHHLLPFWGRAFVGYIPAEDGKLVGVSKLARLVDIFARRLQVQERITDQVADALESHLKPLGVAVVLKAQHLCMTARGVEKQNAVMVTSALRGVMQQHEVRAEFLALVGLT